jgi:hypothetical protein
MSHGVAERLHRLLAANMQLQMRALVPSHRGDGGGDCQKTCENQKPARPELGARLAKRGKSTLRDVIAIMSKASETPG